MLTVKYIRIIRIIVPVFLLFLSSCGSDVDYPEDIDRPIDFDLSGQNEQVDNSNYMAELTKTYNSKVEEYLLDIDINKKKYIHDVTETDSVKTNYDISYGIISKYAEDSDSITESEWQVLQNTNRGYRGVGLYNETEDKYGYDSDRNQANEFETLSYNLLDPKYREELVDEVISDSKKDRYKELLDSQNGQSQIQEYSDKYRQLAVVFNQNETELNSIYEKAVQQSIENKNAIDKAVSEVSKQKLEELKKIYESELSDFNTFLKENVTTIGMIGRTVTFYYSTHYIDNREVAKRQYQHEIDELNERMGSIRTGNKIVGSKVDRDFNFGSWPKFTPEEKQLRHDRIFGLGTKRVGELNILGEIDARIRHRCEAGRGKLGRILDDLSNPTRSDQAKESYHVINIFIDGAMSKEDMLTYLMVHY